MILSKEEIQKNLEVLVNKWKGKVPKSDMEFGWWKFKADRTLALRYRDQLAFYDKYLEREKEILAAEQKEKEEMVKYEEIFK